MCRLFGFRSVFSSRVHKSLVRADNAIRMQSEKHPDGWGVAYYIDNVPHVIKSTQSAIEDNIFEYISGVVSAKTVMAHIRRATHGVKNTLNTHPFQYGRWTFAHNGHIPKFEEQRDELLKLVHEKYRPYILGSTDSEVIFYIILSHIDTENECIKKLKDDTNTATQRIIDIVGTLPEESDGSSDATALSYLLTNGESMIAHAGGKELHYSTHKTRCSDRDDCPYLNESCENENASGSKVNHLIISSEVLQGENVWHKIPHRSFVGIDKDLVLWK